MSSSSFRNYWLAFSAVLVMALGTGCQRKYDFSRVCDYAVFDGQIYLLVLREEGIDKSSRFAHSAAFQPTRRVLGIVRGFLGDSNRVTLELLGKRELSEASFLNSDTFLLCSTNSFVATTDAESVDVIFIETEEGPSHAKRLPANRVAFTASRRFLLACGKSPSVLDARSLIAVVGARASEAMELTCKAWSGSQIRVAVSDDLGIVVIQDETANPPGLTVTLLGDIAQTNFVALPDATFRLQSVHRDTAGIRVVCASVSASAREMVVVFDTAGKELGRAETGGTPVTDTACTKVFALSSAAVMQLQDGENLTIKLWLPDQNRETVLWADTSSILASLSSKIKP